MSALDEGAIPVRFTLEPADITSARLLAIGIRPTAEFLVFAAAVAGLLAWSVSPWRFDWLPLLIGLTACLGAFRVIQIGKVKEAALAAYHRNPTLRQSTSASWDDGGVTIQPVGGMTERIPWKHLQQFKENERVVLLLQEARSIHAIPKRAFPSKSSLTAFRILARRHRSKLGV